MRYVSAVVVSNLEEYDEEEYFVFGLNNMNRNIYSIKVTKEVLVHVGNEEIDIGTSDVKYIKTFQNSNYHTDVTAYYFIDKWDISLAQSTITLKNPTHKLLYISDLPLASR